MDNIYYPIIIAVGTIIGALLTGYFMFKTAKYKALLNVEDSLPKDIIDSLIGPYKGYFHRQVGEIEEFSLKISKDKSVRILELDDEYSGVIEFNSNNLICTLQNRYKRRRAYMIFYVGLSKNLYEIPGVYASLSASGKPVVGNILLQKTSKEITPRVINVNSEEYLELNKSSKNIGKFLIGKTQNYIESSRKNDFDSLSHDEDFGDVYYNLSKYFLLLKNEEKSLKYLDLSYNHGFGDKKRMQEMLADTRRGSSINTRLNKLIDLLDG